MIVKWLKLCLTSCFLIVLVVSCNKKKYPTFNFSNISITQKRILILKLDTLQQDYILFRTLISELEKSEVPIVFYIKNNTKQTYFIPDKLTGGGNIYLESTDKLNDKSAIFEEFFHAFQYFFYGEKSMIRDETGEIPGGPNYEMEAKLMKSLIQLMQNNPIAETPSQKGLLDFILSLLDDKGQVSVAKLSNEQHQNYINLVKDFQEHWRQRNISEGIDNIYDDILIEDLGPDACLYILNMNNELVSTKYL